ncbi:outer membrane protein assembly factor BamB family protein [Paenibacillus spongiae]|uniref:PQQ-binding-like beta-propeller repeat protein n=1 Tax=Paenibacillus spongiae TaxID=2909671 RepID=A0ABY5SIQ5_9BACL|nr:PQQ-binding-like beta-propeller repeat protein [Paenibacillus spongiae]UVI33524.1 PQQ-binding-like beta-propeller repeat protein [Paenibacillus spongiae]
MMVGSKQFQEKIRYPVIALLVGLALLALIKPVFALDTDAVVTGTVFKDKDADGVKDANEPGIAGMSVSDGKEFTKTDDEGNYSLTVDTARRLGDIVFVNVPSGYKVPVNKDKTPQFYKQLGELQPNEQRVQDFGLLIAPETAKPDFNFANAADVHVQAGSANYKERFIGQIEQINNSTEKPAFIAVSGDLTNRATDQEFLDYMAGTAVSKIPVYPAVGNHDVTPGPDYRTRIDRYRMYLGPEWYSFDYGNRHFVTLENNLGFSEADQLEWLRKDLEANAVDKEVVVIIHKPLKAPQTPNGTEEYIDLLGKYNTVLLLMGHIHLNDVDTMDKLPGANYVLTNSSAYTIDQTPNGFRHVKFKGGSQVTPFKMFDVEKSLSIVNPAPGSKIEQGMMDVLVNAYDTSKEVNSVQYRIDGGVWFNLKKSSAVSWTAAYDARRSVAGKHKIEVKVTDAAGKRWERSGEYEIVRPGSLPDIQAGANWPMFHGNAQHTGKAADALTPELRLAWSYKTPGSILTSSPAIADGVAYIGTRDEDGADHQGVHAVDLKTGLRKWYFKANAQVHSSPAVADGIVYASSIHGTLYALNAASGEKLWEKTVGPQDGSRAWMYYSPTVAEQVVYQAYGGGAIMALDAKTGDELWNKPLAGGWFADSSPVYDNGKVYVGAEGWIVALDAKTGAELWRTKPALGDNVMHSMPAIADGRLYMGLGYKGGLIVALDASTGQELWRYLSTDTSYIAGYTTGSSPALVDGVVYIGMSDGNVVALDAEKGTLLWKYRTKGGIISSPAVSGDTIFIGSNDGNLYSLDKKSGQLLSQYEIGTWVASSPAITGNTLVVGAFDGNLYAFTSQ